MALHGKVGEFDGAIEEWSLYVERLEQYFANDIVASDKKRAILLSGCGVPTYKLIRSLVAPAKLSDKPFAELDTGVQDHHHPGPSAAET